MSNKRLQIGDRRHNNYTLRAPFKDRHGATIRDCRRKISDRRLNNIQAEWMVDKPTQEALEMPPEWQSMEPERRTKMGIFIDLLDAGDVRAREIIDGISNGEISSENALDLLDEYLESKH